MHEVEDDGSELGLAYKRWLEYDVWIGGAAFGIRRPTIPEESDPEAFEGLTRNVDFGILGKIQTVECSVVYVCPSDVEYHEPDSIPPVRIWLRDSKKERA